MISRLITRLRDWLADRLEAPGPVIAEAVQPDPRAADAVRQQRAVTDTHSVKVDARTLVAEARARELAAVYQHEFDTDSDAIAWLIREAK